MLSRKEHNETPRQVPQVWIDEVEALFNRVHLQRCEQDKKIFKAYSQHYSSELVLSVSYLDATNLNTIPSTVFVSVDLTAKTPMKKVLSTVVDAVGTLFDDLFAKSEPDYFSRWHQERVNNIDIFYKVTRENVSLSLMADEILNEGRLN